MDRCHAVGWLVKARHAVDPSVHIVPVEVRKTESLREHVVERCPITDPARVESDDWILHELRFSNPLIRPESIRAISSRSALSCSCRSGRISVWRTASSKSGTHSCTLPRATPKKLRRSGFVKRPLPSAMLAAIESEARLSWSPRKKYPRGSSRVIVQTASAKVMAFW